MANSEQQFPGSFFQKRSAVPVDQIRIRWPEQMRAGDNAGIELEVLASRALIQSFVESMDHAGSGNEPAPAGSYSIVYEARLELPGMRVDPPDVVSISAGHREDPVRFHWNMSARQPGDYFATLWLYLKLIPEDRANPTISHALLAKPMQIEVRNVLGLPAGAARIISVILLFVSLILLRILNKSHLISKKVNK